MLGVDSCVFLIFTTRVDQTNGSTLVKLILFEKSRVELEFVFSIFTTRVRKHFGNSGRLLQFCRRPSNEQNLPNYEPWQCETVKKSHDKALDLKGEPGHETIIQDAVLRSETTGGHFWMTLTAGGHRNQTTGKDVKWGSWSLV